MRVDTDDFARPCGCGKNHHVEVKEILIEEGAVEKLEEAMSDGFLKKYISPLLICDTNTCKVTEDIMEDIYDRCQVLVLDAEDLHADQHAIKIVENNMEEDIDLILAVGTGTIHDISRYMAFQYKIPFISVPTAASVDGFTSTVAAMTWNGYICDEIIKLEEKAMRTVRSCLADISEGDKESCEKLMYALILSGLATQMAGNSRPASCAEHQLSHLWELEVLNGPLDALHGEMVSVGTMIVLREYKRVARAIREGRCSVRTQWEDDTELLEKTFGSRGFFEGIVEENTPEPLLKISPARLEACLDEIAGLIEELPEEEELARMMDRAGCKRSVYEIGLSEEIIPQSLKLAPYVRRRLSFLRILRMLRIEGE